MKNLALKIKNQLLRCWFVCFNLRPDSYPYVSGDGFRKIANHIYDETTKCRAEDIEEGQIIFLKTDLLNEWFINIHPQIKTSYKLITHNSDYNIQEQELKYIDGKIIHWFAQNVTVSHPKVTPLPIGLENKHWFMSGYTLIKNIKKLKAQKIIRKKKVLYGFSVETNTKERLQALKALRQHNEAEEIPKWLNNYQYFSLLNQYEFVASPPGNGTDCHRTWEAMYLGVIPIAKESVCINYFKKIGLPILAVSDYNEIDITKYKVRISDPQMLYMDYWIDKIKNEN